MRSKSAKMQVKTLCLIWLIVWFVAANLTHTPPIDLNQVLKHPSGIFTWGTDPFGRDLLQLNLSASVTSMKLAIISTLILVPASLLIAGLTPALPLRVSSAVRRFFDFLIAFPSILLALGFQAARGSGPGTLLLAITLGALPGLIRYLMGRSDEAWISESVFASRALGARTWRIFRSQILPELLDHLRIKLPFLISQAIILETTLSFLNLGIQPGDPSWGALLAIGKDYLVEAPYLTVLVGAPLFLTLLCIQSLADQSKIRNSIST